MTPSFLPTSMKKDNLKKTIYLSPRTIEDVEALFKMDNCGSQSEFIEKAIRYYVGYLMSDRNTDYLSPTIMSSVHAASDANTARLSRMLFKLAVETAIMSNLLAATIHFDPERYKTLRKECEMEVRKTNGDFSMDDALRWQRKVT